LGWSHQPTLDLYCVHRFVGMPHAVGRLPPSEPDSRLAGSLIFTEILFTGRGSSSRLPPLRATLDSFSRTSFGLTNTFLFLTPSCCVLIGPLHIYHLRETALAPRRCCMLGDFID
jgi:hypothetical protein